MNKNVNNIYQIQLKLARHINNTLNSEWGMNQHTIQLNKLNQYKQIEDSLNSIDLNLYTVFPFDTADYSSYILFHRSFSHQLAMIDHLYLMV